jgi:hypothetical protein
MKVNRKDFLVNLGCAAAGVTVGAVGDRLIAGNTSPAPARLPPPSPPPVIDLAQRRPQGPGQTLPSYSQAGEDAAVRFAAQYLKIPVVNYLDIGAYEPIQINNTYLFYRLGYRGVLVEPNVVMCERIKKERPEDTVLEAGIGVTAVREADYYMMTDPSWNTFSKEEAEHQEEITGRRIKIDKIIKMPLLDINDVMEEHFHGAPTFVSIDAEGLHQAILESIDFTRYRPKIICVETLVSGTNKTIPAIPAFMESKGYVDRGGSFVNTLFIDGGLI